MRPRTLVSMAGVACLIAVVGHCTRRPPQTEFPMTPSSEARGSRVEIRIRNASPLHFDHVRAHLPDEPDVDYGPVASGSVTAFRATSRAYRFAGFTVKAGTQELTLRPIDYMGEQELGAGRYTYALGVGHGRLTVQLEKVE